MHRLIVKPHRPLYSYLIMIAAGIALFAGVWLLLNYYQPNIAQELVTPKDAQSSEGGKRSLESENRALGEKIIRLERDLQIDRMTAIALQKEIMELQGKVGELTGELEFYQSIMGSTQNSNGLNIHKLLVEPMKAPYYYRFKLILTHVAKDRIVAVEGEMDLLIDGIKDGNMQILKLKDIVADGEWVPNFKFKNFKRIHGSLVLPEGFEPVRITARLDRKGRKNTVIEKTLDWSDAIKQ